MATVTTILAKIRQNVVSLPSDTEERLVDWINEAQVEAESTYGWTGLDTSWGPITTEGSSLIATSGAPTVRKPADWLVARGNPFWYGGDSGEIHQMEWASSSLVYRKDIPHSHDEGSRGSPQYLFEDANAIWMFPVADASNIIGHHSAVGEYQILIRYRKSDTVLNDTTNQENFFTGDANLARFLEDYASGQAMLFNKDFDNANTYLMKAKGHFLRAKRLDKAGKMQHFTLAPRRDVYASRRQARAT
jgi:hypothetical protein